MAAWFSIDVLRRKRQTSATAKVSESVSATVAGCSVSQNVRMAGTSLVSSSCWASGVKSGWAMEHRLSGWRSPDDPGTDRPRRAEPHRRGQQRIAIDPGERLQGVGIAHGGVVECRPGGGGDPVDECLAQHGCVALTPSVESDGPAKGL